MWLEIKKNWRASIAVALLSATLVAAAPIFASTVTSPSDNLSTEEAGTAANHSLFFTTSSGVTESKIITLTFSSDFNTASLTEDDVDVTDDGSDLTTAANCSGTEKASVTIASDIVTITICAGDGGAITAGSIIGVEIGTNATSSGTGANQITNPTGVGTYFVTIGGDFGDTGSIAIPIISDGSVGVTGTVPGSGGGSSPPNPGSCTDTIAPIISSLSVSTITTTSATITWMTDEPTSGTVNYGLTASYEIAPLINSSLAISHSLTLTGLISGGTYHYSVTSSDFCGNSTSSSDATFTTIDVVAPVISNIEVLEITTDSARVIWTTNEATLSRIDYGKTTAYGSALILGGFPTSFSVPLTGLSKNTVYHFKITATDSSGNSAVSSDQTFTTLTDTPPSNVSEFKATAGDEQIELSWVNPTDSDFSGVAVIFCSDDYPTSRTDSRCFQIYNGAGTSFTHTGLTNGTTYFYGAFAYDVGGHYASGALTSATPSAETEEPTNDVCGDSVCSQTESTLVCPIDCPEIPTDICGDGICGSSESSDSCLADCPTTPIPTSDTCGDEICGESESPFTCFIDCGTSEPTDDVCGDGVCGLSESSLTCFVDCGTNEPADVCGDGTCGLTETIDNCSADCLSETDDVCGNGECSGLETSLTCPIDCPTTPIPVPLPTDSCGDRICGLTENIDNCPIDCLSETGDVCGNNSCDNSESPLICPVDCGETTEDEVVCGNAICEEGETAETCSSDCSSIEIPPTTVTEGEEIPSSDVSFAGAGIIELGINNEGVVDFLTSSKVSIIVSETNITKEVASMYLALGAETYLLSYTDGAYRADVTTPGTSTRHALSVVITYTDSTVQTLSFIANLLGPGLVYEKIDGQTIPVSSVATTLYVSQNGGWTVWNGSLWNQFNPITTNDSGTFAWYVENGSYKITVSKNGYEDVDSGTIVVTNNIVNSRIEIKKVEEVPVTNIASMAATITKTFQGAVANVAEVVNNIGEISQAVRESPAAQTVAVSAAPIIATAIVISTVILATAFDLLPFLQLLFTSPLLLFKRRKRKAYGVVYHAFTKAPIDLATVRLYQMPENKLIMSRVTDKGGRYFFMIKSGNYRVEVAKPGFIFPAQTMKEIKDDVIYLDVYHGEQIEVSEKDTIITPNIPLEPAEATKIKTPHEIKKKQLLRGLQKWMSLTGIIVSAYVFWMRFSVWSALLLGLQVAVYLLIRRLATTPKPKSWGIVYDKTTGRPLSRVVVRLFEPKYHKLLETWVTDAKGRYSFILGPSEYSTTYEKTGYQTAEIQPIDLTKNKDVIGWAQDLKLEPKTNSETSSAETK
ncbi:MAG: carboxypeptidase regulatory-like domain-containing protein [Candidatus Uhrbacteria bacterium]